MNADHAAGGPFVAAWQQRTGDRPRVRVHLRLYRLSSLTAPQLWPAGRARVAQAADRDLLVAWCAAFRREESSGPENAAAGVTFAMSQAALDAGVRDVVLFTDLASPPSNALYQRLGYRPAADRVEWSFSSRGPR